MTEPARDLPVNSRTIVPDSILDALRATEDAEDVAEADAAMDEPIASAPWDQVKAELDL
jgi:hypothetical protein